MNGRNVIFIVLDSVRKDYFDVYATQIRERSDVSFSNCRAASSWSVPSHASMLTGLLPHQHEFHADSFSNGVTFADLRGETFIDELDGYRTIGLSANPYANSSFGFDTLFDEFHDYVSHGSVFPEGLSPYTFDERSSKSGLRRNAALIRACLSHRHPARSLLNAIWQGLDVDVSGLPLPGFFDDGARPMSKDAHRLATETDEPFFLFANLMDGHSPFENSVRYDQSLHSVPNSWSSDSLHNWEINKDNKGTSEYFRNYRALYGATIDHMDRHVGQLIDRIQSGTDRETTVIVTADHGNNLGYPVEDGLIHHTGSMSEGITHVPLEIVNPPDGYPDTVDDLYSHLSLPALVQDIVQERPFDEGACTDEVPAETIGLSGTGDPRNYRDFEAEEFRYWNRMIRCVYTGNEKIEWDTVGGGFRYRLDENRPCWQEQLEEGIEGLDDSNHFDVPAEEYKESVSSETGGQRTEADLDRLRQLGYI